jgi:hypothetical protein
MKNYFLFSIFSILASCESTVKNFNIKEPTPKLVAYSFAFPDSTPKIFISRNTKITKDLNYDPVENVHIKLYHGNELLSTLAKENDYYTNPSIQLQPNISYRYSIESEGFPSAEAAFYIPEKPLVNKIDSQLVKTRALGCHNCPEFLYLKLTVNFNDNSATKDYYSLQVVNKRPDYENDETNGKLVLHRLRMESETPFIEISKKNGGIYSLIADDNVHSGERFFFSDQYFNGKNEITLDVYILRSNIPCSNVKPLSEFIIHFSKIDQHFFEHVRSKGKFYDRENGNNPLAEAVSIYTNVSNGLGIVTGTNSYIKTFEVDCRVMNGWKSY